MRQSLTLRGFAPVGLLAAAALAAGCDSGDDENNVLPASAPDPLSPYPPTGQTKEFALTITDVLWEVGPGALYQGLAYNGQIPGPPIEVDAGDHVVIRLTNQSAEPHSIHTHVVRFTEANDGVDGSVVLPGETKTIEWNAAYAGTFPYHDHGDESEGVVRGLFGALVVHAPDEPPANEHLVIMSDFEGDRYKQLPGVADPITGELPKEGTYRGGHQYLHALNGKAYEDAVAPYAGKVGELSRWRVLSIGKEFHTFHIHGHRWLDAGGQVTDNIQLGPGMYATFAFVEDNPGNWLVHCHVPDHMEGGMMTRYVVGPLRAPASGGRPLGLAEDGSEPAAPEPSRRDARAGATGRFSAACSAAQCRGTSSDSGRSGRPRAW